MITEWTDVDSRAGWDAVLVSMHHVQYMAYPDDVLNNLVAVFANERGNEGMVGMVRDEMRRRRELEAT